MAAKENRPARLFGAFLGLIGCLFGIVAADGAVKYDREIRPILAKNCFRCHGPDEAARKAKLRLDTFEGATADRDGYRALEPGDPDRSEMIRRLTNPDLEERMPPKESKLSVSEAQIDLIRRWIAAGGGYERHWSFVPPARPDLPDVRQPAWARNPIDYFVLARLEAQHLSPSPEADRYTLLRRVYLDLIGLPPTPEEADAFVRDEDPLAYEWRVDRLLASPRYGERWARKWLDLARYADTNGYEKDRPRSMWPYRDWVIRALNADMPFDRFSIEQLAGDMLPDATLDQRIATGFHRNTMLNEEGGIDPLEYRFYAMLDRVATTGTVWMGLTVGCARCHDHKFDPITQLDYYRMMALLNNADEPEIAVPDPGVERRRREIEAEIARLEGELPGLFPPLPGGGEVKNRRQRHLNLRFAAWLKAEKGRARHWKVIRPYSLKTNLPRLEVLDDGSIFSSGDITKRDVYSLRFHLEGFKQPVTALRLEVLPDPRLPGGGPGRCYYEGRKGDFFLSELTAVANGKTVSFGSASHSFGKISVGSGSADAENVFDGEGSTGWSTSTRSGEAHQLVLNFKQPVEVPAELEITMLFERHFAASLGRFRLAATSDRGQAKAKRMPVGLEAILARDEATWSPGERQNLRRYFLSVAPELAEPNRRIAALRKALPQFPTTLVMLERPAEHPRTTHRHHRGEYLQPKEAVAPGVPAVFPPLPAGAPANRLSFARWLVSERNPLAARVAVNRAWQAIFGRGIVKTCEDFGTQSSAPTHPRLLDWLATEFVREGWSFKKLHRLIVTSATYRQSSEVQPERRARDPENRFLARGPRVRVDAEMVRDIGLKASGLLSTRIGGPSVFPPQPASVTALAYGGTTWRPSKGEDRYRRSIYTFSKRTAPFAAYTVFNGPTGESCVPRRERSNTPLQALTLWNDAMFGEMARRLAREAMARTGGEPGAMARFIFRRCLIRPPAGDELSDMLLFYRGQRDRFGRGGLSAARLLGTAAEDRDWAAWTLLARVLLNLDETITKE